MALKQLIKHQGLRALALLSTSDDTPLQEIKNFVILQYATALGTAIHSTPLIPALRAAVPNARIVVMASGFGREVFAHHPGVDALIGTPSPLLDFRGAKKAIKRWLPHRRDGGFATLTPTGNERSAIALAAWRAHAENRVGFTLAPHFFRTTLQFDPAQSQIANNLRIVEALGHSTAQHFEPQVFFTDDELAQARSVLGSEYDPLRPLAVFVTQTSSTQRKSWRRDRFVAAAQFLVKHFGAQIVFVGTSSEREAIEYIRAQVRGTTWNVAGQTNLLQLTALLSLCTLGLTLDTGTMHLGRSVKLPMVIIAPAWSPPIEWLPLNNPRFTILKNADLATAPKDYIIDEVFVEDVTSALADLLQRYPRGAAS